MVTRPGAACQLCRRLTGPLALPVHGASGGIIAGVVVTNQGSVIRRQAS